MMSQFAQDIRREALQESLQQGMQQGREQGREPGAVAIFCETRNGVHPISGFAKNQATAMAFGGPRSSCVRPGAHSARRQDSRNDLTPCRMALHFVSAGARAPHSDETLGPTATRGSSHSARRLRSLAFLCSSDAESLEDVFSE